MPKQSELMRLTGVHPPAVSADYCTWARFAWEYASEASRIVKGRPDFTGDYVSDLRTLNALISSKVPAELAETIDVLRPSTELRLDALERGYALSDEQEDAIHTLEFEHAEDLRVAYWREVCGVPL